MANTSAASLGRNPNNRSRLPSAESREGRSEQRKAAAQMSENEYGLGTVCQAQPTRGKAHFLKIMIFILFVLVGRVIVLSEQFIQNDIKSAYLYVQTMSVIPFFFESMCILYVCRFKAHIIHIHERKQASLRTRVFFFLVFVGNGLVIFLYPIVKCMNIDEDMLNLFNITVLGTYYCFMMTLSLVLCRRLAVLMNFGRLKQNRARLIRLEVLIQAILAFHFALGFGLQAHASEVWRVLVEATYFTLSELGPFVAVVIAFFHQVNIYRDEL